MSLDHSDLGGQVGLDKDPFFANWEQAYNRDRMGSGATRTTTSTVEPRGRSDTTSNPNTHANAAEMDIPMPMKRISTGLLQFSSPAQILTPSQDVDTKELRDFRRAYMHTPFSDTGGGEFGKYSSKGTPLAAGGHRKRVASLLGSKMPIVERDMGMMYGGSDATVQHHGNDHREDLRSYEAAVMSRKASTMLNLRPRMAREGSGDANVRSSYSLFLFFLSILIHIISA